MVNEQDSAELENEIGKEAELNENNCVNSDQKEEVPKKKKSVKEKVFGSKQKEEIQILTEKNEELKDKYLRLIAEYDNYRKRTAKEKLELREMAKSSIILDFLPIIDDMDRAIMHIEEVKDIAATKEGIRLIYQKFCDFVKFQGVTEIEAKDKVFDTDLHEAITKFPVEDEEMKGKVIDVVQKGYRINDKVIRFSQVVVGE
jgi:molecular chaperone GrpE